MTSTIKQVHTASAINIRVGQIGRAISDEHKSARPLLVAVLTGSVFFAADLMRAMTIGADIDFMSLSAFDNTSIKKSVRIVKDTEIPVTGRRVVLIEDIVDTGLSLSYLLRTLQDRSPHSLQVCTLIDKPAQRITEPKIDFKGFTTDQFLIGYGLDLKGRYRSLPYLAAVSDVAALAAADEPPDDLFNAPLPPMGENN